MSAAADCDGLFGPDTVTWRIHADPVMGLAALRALLLQALHPLAMAGVAQHSDYRSDPWGRLMRTAEYVATVSYGSAAEAERAAARVRGLHRRLGGIEPESGVAYRVDDPVLLRWVHCAEVDSILSTYRRGGGRCRDTEADTYLREQATAARLIGLDPASVPTTQGELADYFTGMRPALRTTRAAREAARFIVTPPMPGWVSLATPARPAWAGVTGLAFALLPRWARRLYGAPGLPTTDLAASIGTRALRVALLAVPPALRDGPHLKAARARLAAPAGDGPTGCLTAP